MNSQTAHGIRRRRSLVVLFLALAVVAVIGIAAQQALAYNTYVHGGIDTPDCGACHLNGHTRDTPVNEVCITCHPGFAVPNATTTCWTCHNPGQDMSSASTAAACTLACHLLNAPAATVTGTPHNPHPDRGVCTTCHNVSTSPTTANGSPHHTTPTPTWTPTPTPTPTSTPTPTPTAKPKITKLSPTSGKRGVTVTITGTGFRAKRSTSYVKFGVTKCSKYLSWSKTRIKCRVPAKVQFGWLKVRVTTTVGASNAKSFRVKR